MNVSQLKLSGFRNYPELELNPGPGINILHGENAQGKSNVLEAISLLATTRSLRASRESELIYKEAEMAHVTAEIQREIEGEVDLQISVFQGDKKAVKIHGLKRTRVIDLLGEFNAVFFGSIDIPIVTGDPSERRHYLNSEISQISPRYVYDLARYKRILEQRNRLLKDLRERPRPDSGIEAWNEQLVQYGAPLIEKRHFYIQRLAPIACRIHQDLTEERESMQVRYVPSVDFRAAMEPGTVSEESAEYSVGEAVDDDPEVNAKHDHLGRGDMHGKADTEKIAECFRNQLTSICSDEMRRGTTLLGPQRDDMAFLINGVEARTYGSQG
jgi:DNA replication and repair protein RecF